MNQPTRALERGAAQPVAAQVLHARGERQGRRLDRRRGRVPPPAASAGHGGRSGRRGRRLRVGSHTAGIGDDVAFRVLCQQLFFTPFSLTIWRYPGLFSTLLRFMHASNKFPPIYSFPPTQ